MLGEFLSVGFILNLIKHGLFLAILNGIFVFIFLEHISRNLIEYYLIFAQAVILQIATCSNTTADEF